MCVLFLRLLPGLIRNSRLSDCNVLSIHLDADESESFAHGCLAGAAASHEWVENHTTRRRDQAAEVCHQVGRLNGRVSIAFSSVFLAGLSAVEETGSSTQKFGRLITSVVNQVRWPAS